MAVTEHYYARQQARHLGLGNADTTAPEWVRSVRCDTYASYVEHPAILQGLSIAHGMSIDETRHMYIDRMVAAASEDFHLRAQRDAKKRDGQTDGQTDGHKDGHKDGEMKSLAN